MGDGAEDADIAGEMFYDPDDYYGIDPDEFYEMGW